MNWFEGSIRDAVKAAKMNNCFFAVYVEGNDKLSETMTSVINSNEISALFQSDKFVSVKIQADSDEYCYFVEIYKHVPIPSLFLIGLNGVPIGVIHNSLDEDEQKIRDEIFKIIKETELISTNIFISEITSQILNSGTNSGEDEPNKNISIFSKSFSKSVERGGIHESVFKINYMKNVAEVEMNKVESLALILSNEQEINKDGGNSSSGAVLKITGCDVTNSTPDKENEESINDGATGTSPITGPADIQGLFSELFEADAEQSDLTEESIIKDQQGRSKEVTEGQSSGVRNRLTVKSSTEKKQNFKAGKLPENVTHDLERQRILKEIKQDKEERMARNIELIQRNRLIQQTSVSRPNSEQTRILSREQTHIQFRTPDGQTVTKIFNINNLISDLRSFVSNNIQIGHTQFNLAVAFPSHTFTTEENNNSLEELGLIPNAVILILPVTADSSILSTVCTRISNISLYIASPIISGLLFLRENLFRPISNSLRLLFRISFVTLASHQLGDNSSQASSGSRDAQFSNRFENVHIMTHRSDNNDDKNNTWNGNSTQQSQ